MLKEFAYYKENGEDKKCASLKVGRFFSAALAGSALSLPMAVHSQELPVPSIQRDYNVLTCVDDIWKQMNAKETRDESIVKQYHNLGTAIDICERIYGKLSATKLPVTPPKWLR